MNTHESRHSQQATRGRPRLASGAESVSPCVPALLPLLSARRVGELTGRSPRTVRGWIADGKLNAIKKLGRIYVTQEALSEFLKEDVNEE